MGRGRANRIENSIYQKFIIECIEKDLIGPQIHKLLLEKGVNISIPTINKYIKEVKKQGINVTKFKTKTESAALAINEKLKQVPELTSIFTRRNYLIENLIDRRTKVMEYANEGKRKNAIFSRSAQIIDTLEKLRKKMKVEDFLVLSNQVRGLTDYCNANFLPDIINPQLEDAIRKYTMDIHEICKYVEQWTSKYEIDALMEKLTEMITRSAVSTFGPLLKAQTEANRQHYIDKFISEVELAVEQIKEYQLKLLEKKNV